ncbi:uncharacterized protein LOC101855698 [Aplysia californica]|uniref:Uncharacterized protein LOC101855698 n=1 Tax=Aplysia californica TaxID=6500 RepID=A0ABM1W466_APLCA|nr:uncharacterized protein LOC101855698 [Aplysia californica]
MYRSQPIFCSFSVFVQLMSDISDSMLNLCDLQPDINFCLPRNMEDTYATMESFLWSLGTTAVPMAPNSGVWASASAGIFAFRCHVIWSPFPEELSDDVATVRLPQNLETKLEKGRLGVLLQSYPGDGGRYEHQILDVTDNSRTAFVRMVTEQRTDLVLDPGETFQVTFKPFDDSELDRPMKMNITETDQQLFSLSVAGTGRTTLVLVVDLRKGYNTTVADADQTTTDTDPLSASSKFLCTSPYLTGKMILVNEVEDGDVDPVQCVTAGGKIMVHIEDAASKMDRLEFVVVYTLGDENHGELEKHLSTITKRSVFGNFSVGHRKVSFKKSFSSRTVSLRICSSTNVSSMSVSSSNTTGKSFKSSDTVDIHTYFLGMKSWSISEIMWESLSGILVTDVGSENSVTFTADIFSSLAVSSLVISPNPIDFADIAANFSSYLEDSPHVLAANCLILLLSLLVVIWLRRKDKADQKLWRYLPLADDTPSNRWLYALSVHTAVASPDRSTCTPHCMLVGERGRTSARVLVDNVRQEGQKRSHGKVGEAEEAAAKGEQGNVYKITRIICGKYHGGMSGPIKDKAGKLLTIEKEQEARWTEHFREVLNQPPPEDTPDIQEPTLGLDISSDPPQKQEIVKAVKSMKTRKSPGMDNLNAELFKVDPELTAAILQPLFKTIWEGEQIPEDWSTGVIVKVPKKGALRDCNNWRGITLLSVPSKILAKIIINRMSDAVDSCLRKEQAGFRKERRCTDQIFALRNIIEQCTEWQRHLYVNFVDFEKAFDSVHRESLWYIL